MSRLLKATGNLDIYLLQKLFHITSQQQRLEYKRSRILLDVSTITSTWTSHSHFFPHPSTGHVKRVNQHQQLFAPEKQAPKISVKTP